MKIIAKENLTQLKQMLESINTEIYNEKPEILFGSSIGQHVRHILEFYQLMIVDSGTGIISYDKRKRDMRIEAEPEFALFIIDQLFEGIKNLHLDDQITFDADYSIEGDKAYRFKSSVGREFSYCIEHSIHHQALIKAALISLGVRHVTEENFGIAYSTQRYRKEQCAQ